ncbi:ATP-dependent nuclease [Sphaerisporangium dianthi]|uniref:ATP-dependent endonuclease n=1 Tax=Sphaerisporangium dianthi TaxID=1436120 RepID=A0ABV9C7T7_9ACTN
MSGKGLPGMLQALQSPSADRYREDIRKFQLINQFMKDVLEDSTVEILVPYNSKTVHIQVGDRVLPLENLGAGVSQILLIATIASLHNNALICIEEPETNLNPIMLRKLVRHLNLRTSNMYLMTTHSSNLLDDPSVAILQVEYDSDYGGTQVSKALTASQRARIAQHLGYRASDLIQSNAIVWVEGPSDRIYVNHWISTADPRLIEGAHYSVMFYGGRLLAHLTGEVADMPEQNTEEFIQLLPINRNPAILIDSDKRDALTLINATKWRVCSEVEDKGGISWVTAGREIENYVPVDIFVASVQEAHPSVQPQIEVSEFSSRFQSFVKSSGPAEAGKIRNPNKVIIAEKACAMSSGEIWDVLDLRQKVEELVSYLQAANHLDPLPGPLGS